jgi:hypothetical protein
MMSPNSTFSQFRSKVLKPTASVCLILLCACDALPFLQASTPATASEAGIPESQLLYSDDFSSQDSGWSRHSSAEGSSIDYAHQGLEIRINEPDKDYWSTRPDDFSDVGVAVDISKLGGPDDNLFGVICRFQDQDHYYAFLASSDGYYGIIKVVDGKYSLLSGKNMDYDAGIVRGIGTNRMAGICEQDYLGLYVNGKLLTIVQDSDLKTGKIGVIAGTNAAPGVDILFDNFILYKR